jgi:hypothetical protein
MLRALTQPSPRGSGQIYRPFGPRFIVWVAAPRPDGRGYYISALRALLASRSFRKRLSHAIVKVREVVTGTADKNASVMTSLNLPW